MKTRLLAGLTLLAAFAASAICAMVVVSGGSVFSMDPAEAAESTSHGHSAGSRTVAAILPFARTVAHALDATTAPYDRTEALDRLGDGVRIPRGAALRAFALDGIALPLLLGLLGSAVLRRRELP